MTRLWCQTHDRPRLWNPAVFGFTCSDCLAAMKVTTTNNTRAADFGIRPADKENPA